MAWIQQGSEGFRRIGTRISARHPDPHIVMPGLVPGIPFHRFRCTAAWMPGTSPGMTRSGRIQARWKARGQETLRASKTPARLRPMAKPDSSGTSPGMTGRGMTGRGMTKEPAPSLPKGRRGRRRRRRAGRCRAGGDPCGNVMFCHAGPSPPGCAARAVRGRLRSSAPPSRQRAGRGVPVLRVSRAGAGGCRRRRGSCA